MRTTYECDRCWTRGTVQHAKDAGVWEVAEKILDDHDRRWPKCKAGFDEIRCWLPRVELSFDPPVRIGRRRIRRRRDRGAGLRTGAHSTETRGPLGGAPHRSPGNTAYLCGTGPGEEMTPLEAAAKAIRAQRSRRLITNLDTVADADENALADARAALTAACGAIPDLYELSADLDAVDGEAKRLAVLLRALVGETSVSGNE